MCPFFILRVHSQRSMVSVQDWCGSKHVEPEFFFTPVQHRKVWNFQKTPTTNGTEYKSLEHPHKPVRTSELLHCWYVHHHHQPAHQQAHGHYNFWFAHHLAICHMCLLMLLMHQEILLKIYALYLSSSYPTHKAQKLATSLFMWSINFQVLKIHSSVSCKECFCSMWWVKDGSHEVGFSSSHLTRVLKPLNSFYNQAVSFFAESMLVTSNWWKWTKSRPSAWKVWSAISPLTGSRAVRTMVRPCFARPWTILYPRPLLLPITATIISFDHHDLVSSSSYTIKSSSSSSTNLKFVSLPCILVGSLVCKLST